MYARISFSIRNIDDLIGDETKWLNSGWGDCKESHVVLESLVISTVDCAYLP